MNIILITIDALRTDKLHHAKEITQLKEAGTNYTNCITASTGTTPSHASIMTSNYPDIHQATENGWKIDPELTTLAQTLKKHKYKTCAIVSVESLASYTGLNKGFDDYYNSNKWDNIYCELSKTNIKAGKKRATSTLTLLRKLKIIKNTHSRPGKETTKIATNWLKQNHNKKFFLWIHYFDIHKPYKNNKYENSVKETDKQIKKLKWEMKKLKLLNKTTFIITADHGEMLGEYGLQQHGHSTHDQEAKVPLIITKRWKKEEITQQTRTIDIAPTILDILKIKPPENWRGTTLLPYAKGKPLKGLDAYTDAYPPFKQETKLRKANTQKITEQTKKHLEQLGYI